MSFTTNGILGVIQEGVHFIDNIESFAVTLPFGRTMQRLKPAECLKGRIILKLKTTEPTVPSTMHATLCCMKQTFVGDEENNIHSILDYYTQRQTKKCIFVLNYVQEKNAYIAEFSPSANQVGWNEVGLYHCYFRLVHPCVQNVFSFPKFQWCELMDERSVFPMSDQFIVEVK